MQLDSQDAKLLRASFDVAQRAVAAGNHPFGAILADREGQILLEAENTVVTEHDLTAHSETNLVRMIHRDEFQANLEDCTLYASNEPCAMCSGAIYWAGIGRVVFGLSQRRFYAILGADRQKRALALGIQEVMNHGGRSVEVIGPALEEEAAKVHEDSWS